MKIRTVVCALVFLAGFKFGTAHIPVARLFADAVALLIGSCVMIIHSERAGAGYPNKFGIPCKT